MNDRKKRPPLRAEIYGRAGGDAERKYSQSGREYVRLSVALNCRKPPRDAPDDERPKALWVSVIASRGEHIIAGLAEVRKGAPVIVAGEMRLEQWVDRNRNARESWTLFVDPDSTPEVNGRPIGERREPEPRATERGGGYPRDDEDDIPFHHPPAWDDFANMI